MKYDNLIYLSLGSLASYLLIRTIANYEKKNEEEKSGGVFDSAFEVTSDAKEVKKEACDLAKKEIEYGKKLIKESEEYYNSGNLKEASKTYYKGKKYLSYDYMINNPSDEFTDLIYKNIKYSNYFKKCYSDCFRENLSFDLTAYQGTIDGLIDARTHYEKGGGSLDEEFNFYGIKPDLISDSYKKAYITSMDDFYSNKAVSRISAFTPQALLRIKTSITGNVTAYIMGPNGEVGVELDKENNPQIYNFLKRNQYYVGLINGDF